MRKFLGPMGSVSRVAIESQVLKSNLLGDPSVRVVDVYVPAGHDGQGLPLLVDLVGFTSSGLSHAAPLRRSTRWRWPPATILIPRSFMGFGCPSRSTHAK